MARPVRKGLDYFPFDVGFVSDLKIRIIARDCGLSCFSVIITLLCYIYRDGYYIAFNDDLISLLSIELGCSEVYAREVINKALRVELFDKRIFDSYHILTSRGIQKRYSMVCRRKDVVIDKNLNLLDDEQSVNEAITPQNQSKGITPVNDAITPVNDAITPVNDAITPVNDAITPQRKEKESKLNIKESKTKVILLSSSTKKKNHSNQDQQFLDGIEQFVNDNKNTPGSGMTNKQSSVLQKNRNYDWQEIKESWNRICGDVLPPIKMIDENRKVLIRSRMKELDNAGMTINDFFKKIRKTAFLTGENGKSWRADFNFCFTPSKFTRILEGAYDNVYQKSNSVSRYSDRLIPDYETAADDFRNVKTIEV